MLEGIEKLPLWFQIVASAGVFVAGALAALGGYLKKQPAPAPISSTSETPQNALILGAAIADSMAIRDLAQSIRALEAMLQKMCNRDELILDALHNIAQRDQENGVAMSALAAALNNVATCTRGIELIVAQIAARQR